MENSILRHPSARGLAFGGVILLALGALVWSMNAGFETPEPAPAARVAATSIEDARPVTTPPKPPKAPKLISIERLGASLLAVIALLVVLGYGARRFMRGGRFAPRGERILEVVDALPLGAKRYVYVVKAYGRRLVIGATPDNLSLISEFNDEEIAAAAGSADFVLDLSREIGAATAIERERA